MTDEYVAINIGTFLNIFTSVLNYPLVTPMKHSASLFLFLSSRKLFKTAEVFLLV